MNISRDIIFIIMGFRISYVVLFVVKSVLNSLTNCDVSEVKGYDAQLPTQNPKATATSKPVRICFT